MKDGLSEEEKKLLFEGVDTNGEAMPTNVRMEIGENMTEQEFINEAKKRGIRDDNILKAIETYKKLKEYLPNITLEEMMETTIQTQEKIDSDTDDFVSVD